MAIEYRGGVSIGEIIVYIPALAIAILLAVRHGFGRAGGWVFLMIFSLARILGAAFQLATISHPTSTNYTASAVLTTIGFGPLELTALSLVSRLIADVHKNSRLFITTQMVKMVELLVTVGVILGIVGGINAGDQYDKTGKFVLGPENQAGTALLIVAFAFTVLGTVALLFSISHSSKGERHIFWALAASLPFLFIRLIYSCLSTYSHKRKFSLLGGSTTVLLCVALLEELAVVIIYESVGLTLKKQPKQDEEHLDFNSISMSSVTHGAKAAGRSATQSQSHEQDPKVGSTLKIVKHLPLVHIGIWAYKSLQGKK
jgi:hypothetical protein